MGHESSASGSFESVNAVLDKVASQLAEQLRTVQERVDRLLVSSGTAERTWLGEVRPQLSALGQAARASQIDEALSRLAGLGDSCTELRRYVEQQLQGVTQVQAGLAELSRNDGVHHAEQQGQIERLAEQLRELRRLTERWSSQSDERVRIDLELQKLPALLDHKFPELEDAIHGLRSALQTHSQQLGESLDRVVATSQGTREILQAMDAGQAAHRSQLDGALGRLQALGSQAFERLTVAARDLQTQQGEQRQQLAHISSDVRAAREDLKPLATGLTELKTQNSLLLPTMQQALAHSLPEQIAAIARQIEQIHAHNQEMAGDIERWFRDSSVAIKSIDHNQLAELIKKQDLDLKSNIQIALKALGVELKMSGPKKSLKKPMMILFAIVFPIAVACGAFFLLQRANESMNVKRVSEVVEEKRELTKSQQSCQADLMAAKLAAQKAEAERDRQIQVNIPKASPVPAQSPPNKSNTPRKLSAQQGGGAQPGASGTLRIEGTVRLETAPARPVSSIGPTNKQTVSPRESTQTQKTVVSSRPM